MAHNDSPVAANISLASTIFYPFGGLLHEGGTRPQNREARLRRILQNLEEQHVAVKENIILLLEKEADRLTRKAKEEIAAVEVETLRQEDVDAESLRNQKERNSAAEMLKRIKTQKSEGSTSADYVLKGDPVAFFKSRVPQKAKRRDVDGDVSMVGTTWGQRSTKQIRRDLSQDLIDLVEIGTCHLNFYDGHRGRIKQEALQALDKLIKRSDCLKEVPSQPPRIKTTLQGTVTADCSPRNKPVESPSEVHSRRMSREYTTVEPSRNYENIEDLSRRRSVTDHRGLRFDGVDDADSPLLTTTSRVSAPSGATTIH